MSRKHNWNPKLLRAGFGAMLEFAEQQELEHKADAVLGSYWSGMKDAISVATTILNEEES